MLCASQNPSSMIAAVPSAKIPLKTVRLVELGGHQEIARQDDRHRPEDLVAHGPWAVRRLIFAPAHSELGQDRCRERGGLPGIEQDSAVALIGLGDGGGQERAILGLQQDVGQGFGFQVPHHLVQVAADEDGAGQVAGGVVDRCGGEEVETERGGDQPDVLVATRVGRPGKDLHHGRLGGEVRSGRPLVGMFTRREGQPGDLAPLQVEGDQRLGVLVDGNRLHQRHNQVRFALKKRLGHPGREGRQSQGSKLRSLPTHDAVGHHAAGLVHLVDKALADRGGHQPRDDVGADHGRHQRQQDVGDDQLAAEGSQPAADALQPVPQAGARRFRWSLPSRCRSVPSPVFSTHPLACRTAAGHRPGCTPAPGTWAATHGPHLRAPVPLTRGSLRTSAPRAYPDTRIGPRRGQNPPPW